MMAESMEKFHQELKRIWCCENCPACYFINNPQFSKECFCMECGNKDWPWVCLICGYIGCGGDSVKGHASEHYMTTNHKYAIELKGFGVWDHEKRIWLHNFIDKVQQTEILPKSSGIRQKSIKCSCPVCHYKKIPRLLKDVACMKCDIVQPQRLWICLICGHVGCNKESKSHAINHYTTTTHYIAVQLNDLTVWHYKQNTFIELKPLEAKSDQLVSEDRADNNEAISSTSNTLSTVSELALADFLADITLAVERSDSSSLITTIKCLERKYQGVDYLTANEVQMKLKNIEKLLHILKDETDCVDKMLCEQEIRLDELLTKANKLKGNIKQTTESNLNANPDKATNKPEALNKKRLATAIVIGLVALSALRFAFKKVTGSITNLF